MDKRIAGLLGAAAAITAIGSANASTSPQASGMPQATTYRELLEPVPNALALLTAENAARVEAEPATVQLAQFHHHHHHHHHHFYHHHHHHHHHGFFGGILPLPPVYGPPAYAPGCWRLGPLYWNGYRYVRRRVWVCD